MNRGEVVDRAILVGAGPERHLEELARLAETLGVEVAGSLEQNRRDGTGYVGKGKREELESIVEETGATLVISDDELTASQARVLERASSSATVVDRTELIIRIFETHARDAASRLEIELADLEYRLPRVKGRNTALSRLGGGVGTRGPGEQQLEYDRRAIRERIETINRKLRDERSSRAVRGARLRREGPPTVALVGYTNAGKTTILNALSGAGRSTRDRLFETLETTARLVEGRADGKIARPDFVVMDTVGFIRKLPKQLVHSFESTMETAHDADIMVLCADASSAELDDEIRTVNEILHGDREDEPEAGEEIILCLNKIDAITESRVRSLREQYPEAVTISALQGEIDPLLDRIYEAVAEDRERMEVLIPHSDYATVSRLYGMAEIHASETNDSGVLMDVTIPSYATGRYARYRVV